MQKISQNHNTVQNSQDEQLGTNKKLHIAGKISVGALRGVLRSAKYCFIPKVDAASKDENIPQRPPPMKYKDLSIYDSPHLRWKNYQDDLISCQDRKVIHECLYPTVSDTRKQVSGAIEDFKNEMIATYKEVSRDYRSAEKSILARMRCPKNANLRMAFVTLATLAGLKKGKTIPRRLFYSSLFAFVSGSLCYPKETDEATRSVLHMLGKAFVPLYNFYFGTDWSLRERVPCQRDMPAIPPPTKPLPACQPKK